MRKVFLLLSALIATGIASAKDHVIVIKGDIPNSTHSTEVKIDGDSYDETILVKPGDDVTIITVEVKDVNGATASQIKVPASLNATYALPSPDLSNGHILEVKDDKGIVYSSYEF